MLLRARHNLSNGIMRGEMFASSCLSPKTVQTLLGRGVIAPATPPPISVLPALQEITDVLQSAGVETLEDLIVAKAVEGLTAAELAGWQSVAVGAMNVEKPCGCRRK